MFKKLASTTFGKAKYHETLYSLGSLKDKDSSSSSSDSDFNKIKHTAHAHTCMHKHTPLFPDEHTIFGK